MSVSASLRAGRARASRAARFLLVRAAAVIVGLALGATSISAQETISAFNANIEVQKDASVHVTENITVRAAGDKIKRGIYRDIPTVLTNSDGSLLRANLDIVSIQKDGRAEPYHTEAITNGIRIYIGDANVFLNPGIYTYTLNYTMTRQVRSFGTYDELYWNVTGNDWDFPIDSATAIVQLPDGARPGDLTGYTGAFGSSEQAVRITTRSDGTILFAATRPLARHEGLTISASFAKGALDPLTTQQQVVYFLSDHRDLILSVIGIFVVLLYNLFAWDAVGRDPAKGTIIPRFYPPEGYSPALVHYVHNMGWRSSGWTAFAAALVDLAVRGAITITAKSKKTTSFSETGERPGVLPGGEAVIFDYLRGKGELSIDKQTGPEFNRTRKAFIKAIEVENRSIYFNNNLGHVIAGFALAVAVLLTMVLSGVLAPLWLVVSIAAGIGFGLIAGAFRWAWGGGRSRFRMFMVVMWGVIVFANLLAAVSSNLFAAVSTSGVPIVSAISIVAIWVVFAVLMRAPTVQGRKIMDEIEGLLMYLDTAEKERLNFVGEPIMSVSRFETLLPYAMALGVEKPWTERFEKDLARHAVEGMGPNDTYHPGWYVGTGRFSSDWGRQISSIGSGISAAMIAAQPTSSSGSGGGGFSGGGGGGGGGGGW